MAKKVVLTVINDVSTDQRVHKIASYFEEKGFEVQVYGRLLPNTIFVERSYEIVRKKHWFNNNFLFYAEYNFRLFFYLLKTKHDLLYVNDLDTLLASYISTTFHKSDLIYDSHEYFIETPELQGRKFVQRVWKFVERSILPKLTKAITVSEPIAGEYRKSYGIEMKVIRNLPILEEQKEYKQVSFPTKHRVVLYQGKLNPGRGLKPMIKALHHVNKVDLVIIGFGKVQNALRSFVEKEGLEQRVHFLGRIPYNELYNYTIKADIGMVLEEPYGKSFKYSLPNKLFDFIHCGIPILASNLPEVERIVKSYNVGLIVPSHNPVDIANSIRKLLDSPKLRTEYIENQKVARKELNWQNEINQLDEFLN
ncbi:hypothetical protein KH5_03470 [Urechidicola sp. KH5]